LLTATVYFLFFLMAIMAASGFMCRSTYVFPNLFPFWLRFLGGTSEKRYLIILLSVRQARHVSGKHSCYFLSLS
jgi:hypothetical protein